ncbi:hypothetical protein [Burkholderia cepacia]|uniref:hypothetical protein n=1 Tax=Burkholderia cepacia TaxID=292 RepID=UPI0012D9ABDD|nr:hypothetical protein [Burkholderia cepacia]NHB09725.1 hypothetical protein [Burkholderia cepacia]UQO38436.1 hypothetical protein L0Z22_22550 [Burkholderia cepacia]UQO52773.1 hypothetical protein L0Z05_28680 [Burkholderia cepacia]UQP06920.1 hypothetical protein L0Z01_05500 [Burkholderia cepacia]
MIEANIVEARRAPPQRLKHIETKSRGTKACNSAAGVRARADLSGFAARYRPCADIRSRRASMAANVGVCTVTRPVACQPSHVLNRTSDSTSTGGM